MIPPRKEPSDEAIRTVPAGSPGFARDHGFLVSLVLGAISAFAFEPFAAWPLMIAAFALLCWLIDRAATLKQSLLVGWGFGVGQFVVGLNWIATAFTFQAKMPAWLGWIAVVLLALYLAVYPMLAAGLAWRFGRARPAALALALAGGWAITEWLRATMFTGFAWNPVGVILVDTPWRSSSAWVGTFGLSALTALAGGALWLVIRRDWRPAAGIAATAGLLLALPDRNVPLQPTLKNFTAGGVDHARPVAPQPPPGPSSTLPDAPPPAPVTPRSALVSGAIRVIQPNIGQADKWSEGYDRIAADRLALLSNRAFPNDNVADTLFWPEAAVTNPLLDERAAAAPLVFTERRRAVRNIQPGQLLATGGIALTSSDGSTVDGATNSVFVFNAAGEMVGRYDKAHLVPYGEYLPMRPILSAIGLSRLAPGDLDFRAGPGPKTLALPNGRKMGIQICYEIIFPGDVVESGQRPDFIFNPSNDAWFGSWGPPQHLAQARLRAAEEGLPIIRATPTGISAVIDSRGRMIGSIGSAKAGIIDAGLPEPAAPTPFARLGNIIPLVLGFILVLAAIVLGRGRRYIGDI